MTIPSKFTGEADLDLLAGITRRALLDVVGPRIPDDIRNDARDWCLTCCPGLLADVESGRRCVGNGSNEKRPKGAQSGP